MSETKIYPIEFTEEELSESDKLGDEIRVAKKRAKRRSEKNRMASKRKQLHGDITKPHLTQTFEVEIIKSPRNF